MLDPFQKEIDEMTPFPFSETHSNFRKTHAKARARFSPMDVRLLRLSHRGSGRKPTKQVISARCAGFGALKAQVSPSCQPLQWYPAIWIVFVKGWQTLGLAAKFGSTVLIIACRKFAPCEWRFTCPVEAVL